MFEADYVRPDLAAAPKRPFTVTRTGDHEFTIDAPWLERILAGTNVEDYESLQYSRPSSAIPAFWMSSCARASRRTTRSRSGEYEFDYVF